MDIKAVIFDLDGTLVDSVEDIAIANNDMLQLLNLPCHDLEKYVNWIGNGARELVCKSLPGKLKEDEAKVNICLRLYNEFYKEKLVNKSKIYSGINDVLDLLEEKGVAKSILTNKPADLAEGVVEELLSNWKFDCIIGQKTSLLKKPDPTEALKIASFYNVKPCNVAFIGDSVVDIETAKNAGMQAVAVTWGYEGLEEIRKTGCKTIIDSSDELMELLVTKIKL